MLSFDRPTDVVVRNGRPFCAICSVIANRRALAAHLIPAMFGGLVSERFYHAYSVFATVFACVSNALLIYILYVKHANHVGPYRWLLISFAAIDILISLVHFALIPAIHLTEFGYIFWGYRMLQLPTEQAVWASLVWAMLFYQTFVITAFHYVYRFVLLCKSDGAAPRWLAWIRRRPWRNWLTIAVTADLLYVGSITLDAYTGFYPSDLFRQAMAPVMMEVYHIDLYAPNRPGFLAIVYWTRAADGSRVWVVHSLVTMAVMCLVFSTSGTVIGYCLVRIVRELAPNTTYLKSTTRCMQKQLFRALLWQTIIPTFTSYLPIAFIFVAPLLTGVSFGGVGTILLMSTQIFPMIDPYLVLFFVHGLDNALPKFLQNSLKNRGSQSSHASSVIVVAPKQSLAIDVSAT